MNYCLICGNELKGCICPRCGFDLSLQREQYPSLMNLESKDEAVWVRLDRNYRELVLLRQQKENTEKDCNGASDTINVGSGKASKTTSEKKGPIKAPISLSEGYFNILYYENETCSLIGVRDDCPRELSIPDTLCGAALTTICEESLQWNHRIKKLILPETLRKIEQYAFYGCHHLQSVQLPYGVEIDNNAFGVCPELSLIRFYGVTKHEDGKIATNAFSGFKSKPEIVARPGSVPAQYAIKMGYHLNTDEASAQN